ncbi:MAG: hypothetical protein ACYC75_01630 [Minisyncoccota bacterium]
MEKHPLHLKNPELQTSPEVNKAVEREGRQTGERIPNNPTERIEAYTDRLEDIFLNQDKETRERNLEMFRDKIYDALIIKKENFPKSYFELQKRIARERGQAVEEIPTDVREQMMDVAIEDQKHSLDAWMNYLSSDDAVYSAWFKYYAWTQVTKLSQFDKERGEFKKRTETTVAPFPDIYREPLAQIADIYEKVKEDNKNLKETGIREAFSKKFPALYAELIQKSLVASMENREEIRGQWVKYEQGKDGEAEKLFESLEGKGTGWCTAGRSTAETQIESGDFYVYYTNDTHGNPVQPRLAIRMDGDNRIGEVRGILPHQNIEPQMQETLDEKLKDFGREADCYKKKSHDMHLLTELEKKTEDGQALTRDELVFLYELDVPIEGFGYERDPRITTLRDTRDIAADLPVVFDCAPKDIAHSVAEISEKTKAYIGPLEPGIFYVLPRNLNHVYTKFPESRLKFRSIELGTGFEDGPAFARAIEKRDMQVTDWAGDLLKNPDFKVVGERAGADLVEVSVAALGFSKSTRYDAICVRAQELGLELCPAEVGPQLRLQYADQPNGENLRIAMKTINDSHGRPCIFCVDHRYDSGLFLWPVEVEGRPGNEVGREGRFVFLRPHHPDEKARLASE